MTTNSLGEIKHGIIIMYQASVVLNKFATAAGGRRKHRQTE